MKVLVTGSTGFVGSHLTRYLAEAGHNVKALVRDPAKARFPNGVEAVRGDISDPPVAGCDAVVHLVAIIVERGERTFARINVGGTRAVLDAMQASGVRRLVHLSALGAGPDERFPYLRSKWLAEQMIRERTLDATILRPSVVFGEGAGFFRPIVWSLRWMPFYPMVNAGRTRFQPIHIRDLCRCIEACLTSPEHAGRTYELGGPKILSFADLVKLTASTLGKRRRMVNLPTWSARPFAWANNLVKDPIVTSEQLDMVVLDNTCGDDVEKYFGFNPVRMSDTDLRWLALL